MERLFLRHVRIADRFLRHLSDNEELSLEILLVLDALAAADKDLPHHRLGFPRQRADDFVVDGQVAPAQQQLALLPDDVLEQGDTPPARFGILRKKNQARAIFLNAGQLDADLAALAREKIVRHLHEDARAVSGLFVAPARAAVREVDEDLQGLVNDIVGFCALQVADEAHAAGVALVARVIKPLRPGNQF